MESRRFLFLIFMCMVMYLVSIGFRLVEIPAWQAEQLKINGEYLMATHDAYTWLAGAEGINRYTGRALSEMLWFLHAGTGIHTATLGFWIPALIAPLVILPVVWLAFRLKQPEVSIVAALLSACSLGFLLRTRVGFLDTDVLTLFFPTVLAVGLLAWLNPWCEHTWNLRKRTHSEPPERTVSYWIGAMVLGLVIQGYIWFYGKPHVSFALLVIAFLLGIYFAAIGKRKSMVFGLLIVLAVGWGGLLGLCICGVVIVFAYYRPRISETWSFFTVFAIIVFGIVGTDVWSLMHDMVEKVLAYAKVSSVQEDNAELQLPAIAQSVREAQNVDWKAMAERMAGHWVVFVLALFGYGYLVWKRPLFLVFLPMLALGFLSVKLGNRFSMFGGVAIGIGLAFGTNRFMIDRGQSALRRWMVQLLLGMIVVWPLLSTVQKLGPNPILPKVYAKTFVELGSLSRQKAQLWQWWDYGYAAQYYAKRRTFGDGGKHDGDFLYPLALVHTTESGLQANQVIKFVASAQMQHYRARLKNGTYPYLEGNATAYSNQPIKPLRSMGPQKAESFVQSLASKKRDWPNNLPEQYFVLSWENLRLAYWISYYGSWDLVTGKGDPGRIHQIRGQARFNLQDGVLQLPQKEAPLLEMDIIDQEGRRHLNFQNSHGVYAILNQLSRELYIMDDTIYNSLMVQMLIGDPKEYRENFELVVEHYPWTRAYRVK
jgi:dolichyl-diphosphooligosaccharide--protein glycosyltransferase